MADDDVDGPAGRALWDRADRVLPGGGIYLTRSADLAGRGTLPGFVAAAEGCRVTDVDGRTYLDLLCANGPNLLGYHHPEVEEAAARQAARATSASMFPPVLVEVVERLVARFPPMAWGVVGKNGSEVVSLAARVARHHTGRRGLVAFRSAYHGNDPELALLPGSGPLADAVADVHRVPWGDPDALVDLAAAHAHELAGVLVNPLDQNPGQPTVDLGADQVAAIHEVRARHGLVVVLDDVRHGFRLHPDGSHHASGLEPDLVCLGKALGNGHAISAVLGREDLRPAARRVLFTSTYMFEAPPMAAAMAAVEVYDRDGVFDHLVAVGERLRAGLLAAAADAGHAVSVTGPPAMPTLVFDDDPGAQRGRAFARAAAERGAILHPLLNWFLSGAHTAADVDEVVAIAADAFAATPPADR